MTASGGTSRNSVAGRRESWLRRSRTKTRAGTAIQTLRVDRRWRDSLGVGQPLQGAFQGDRVIVLLVARGEDQRDRSPGSAPGQLVQPLGRRAAPQLSGVAALELGPAA